jgi:hypothetical protein
MMTNMEVLAVVRAHLMGLELTELSPGHGPGPVLEAFLHDDGSSFDFLGHRAASLPFDVVERFVAEARRSLLPSD